MDGVGFRLRAVRAFARKEVFKSMNEVRKKNPIAGQANQARGKKNEGKNETSYQDLQ